jgi:hypothetical protein
VVISPPVGRCYVIPVCYLLELVKKLLFLEFFPLEDYARNQNAAVGGDGFDE